MRRCSGAGAAADIARRSAITEGRSGASSGAPAGDSWSWLDSTTGAGGGGGGIGARGFALDAAATVRGSLPWLCDATSPISSAATPSSVAVRHFEQRRRGGP